MGGSEVKAGRQYQIAITELQALTGINFGAQLYDRNPLLFHNVEDRNRTYRISGLPERIPFSRAEALIT